MRSLSIVRFRSALRFGQTSIFSKSSVWQQTEFLHNLHDIQVSVFRVSSAVYLRSIA